jgi:hypothetical protein
VRTTGAALVRYRARAFRILRIASGNYPQWLDGRAGLDLAWTARMMNKHSRITHSLKLLPLMIPLTLASASADETTAQQQARPAVVTATITNQLAADSCSYPVTIDGVTYAPDAQSTDRMRDVVPFGVWTAEVTYSVTGHVGTVQCGFGTTMEFPEISVRLRRIVDGQ